MRARIADPSDIGNYPAGLDIPATAGLDPVHESPHADDGEQVRLDTVPAVRAVYEQTVRTLMA